MKKKRVVGKKQNTAKTTNMYVKHTQKHIRNTFCLQRIYSRFFRKQKAESITETYRSLGLADGFGSRPTKPEMIDAIVRYYESRTFSEIRLPKKNANDANLLHIGWSIRRVFDTLVHFRDITHVVIENQISPIATRMKTIQGMLAQYFIMKSALDFPVEIVFVSSSNKLRLGKPTSTEAANATTKRANTRKPKQLSTTPESESESISTTKTTIEQINPETATAVSATTIKPLIINRTKRIVWCCVANIFRQIRF